MVRQASRGTPVVTIGLAYDGVDAVVNDDMRGGELVAEHLLDLGHRDIVHIDGGSGAGAALRREGFVGSMREAGLEARVVDGDFTESSGAAAVAQLLASDSLPSAIFAANDLAAVGVIDALAVAGVSVPAGVSVVGYDNTDLAQLRHVGLTTVNQPRVEMGRLAAEIVLERLESGRRRAVCHVVTPDLIVRNTTGPPLADSRRASA